MSSRRILTACAFGVAMAAAALPAAGQVDARMLRQPDVSRTHIAFVYAGDIWVMPKEGGTAQRLSSPKGEESFPRFSPDGSKIAFSANYDGNVDVYVVPTLGGEPKRLTHHPMPDRVLDWTPDGQSILFASGRESGRQRFNQFYTVSVEGGLPTKLPVPYGEFGAIAPDGVTFAYTQKQRDTRTWKRYRGGWAPEIWTFNLRDFSSADLTHNVANDAQPMWHGRTLYFLSDRGPAERYNIWKMNADGSEPTQVTHFTDFDVTYPAIGPEDLVFQAGGKLYRVSLADDVQHEVPAEVVTDLASLKPHAEKVARYINGGGISPTGKRAVLEARGELFTLPARHGVVLDLTRTSGVAERNPSWSPDGKYVAYWSDRSGEYELTVRAADGTGKERRLTHLGAGFRYTPFWSPDARSLAYIDQAGVIRLTDVGSGRTKEVETAAMWMGHGAASAFRISWSPDGRWMAYALSEENGHGAVHLYDTHSGEVHRVTSGYYDDAQPTFGPDGKYLFLLTNRSFSPVYGNEVGTWSYPNTTRIAAIPLRADVASPLAPRNDEEKPDTAGAEDESAKQGGKTGKGGSEKGREETREHGAGKTPAVAIDLDGFEERLVLLPPDAGNYADLFAASGKVIYRRRPRSGSAGKASPVLFWDLKERKEKTVLGNADGLSVSHDGKKALVMRQGKFAIVDLAPRQKLEHPLATGDMEMTINPRAEWKQIFADAWRMERDYFYDPHMHGVDWQAMRARYGKLLDDAVTRWDVNFVIGELIGEMNSSHTYRGGGDVERAPSRPVGMLGVDWALENGAYRIKHIVRGAPWDSEVRSPLDAPGVDVHEGDYVLAVNDVPLDTSEDPWAAFAGLGGKTAIVTVNDRPEMDGARRVLVKLLTSETRLRNLEWIESNRRHVEEATGGRVGYIYVPNTGVDGQTELVRQFAAQFPKEALIIDERFNSGGQIPDRFIELLNRPQLAYWAVRNGKDWRWPPVSHRGPMAMLINGWSGSGGDAFPYYFKEAGLGPLIGTRTWGGLIGYSGNPVPVDGGRLTVPTFRMYSPKGEWFPEGHGVDPDIEVPEDPTALAKGTDPQIERAIRELMAELKAHPAGAPKRPAYEDRTVRKRGGGR